MATKKPCRQKNALRRANCNAKRVAKAFTAKPKPRRKTA